MIIKTWQFKLIMLLNICIVPCTVFANYFTLPVDIDPSTQIRAWFDHASSSGVAVRYDGETNFEYENHNGTDLDGDTGDDIMAPRDGEIVNTYFDTCGGYTTHMWHGDIGLSTLYAHLDSFVATTSNVARFEHIAEMGNTGDPSCTSGAHLHFGVTDGYSATSSNRIDPFGWSGATTDPWPYNQGYLFTTNPPSLCDEAGKTKTTLYPSFDTTLVPAWNNNWNVVRNGPSVTTTDTAAAQSDFRLSDWYNGITLYRFHAAFDTSNVYTKNISTASLFINFSSVAAGNFSSHNGWVVTPSDYTGANADAKWDSYTAVIGTPYSAETSLTSPGGYTEFALNGNGTSSINSANTKLGLISYWDLVNTDPNQSYGPFKNNNGTLLLSEQAGIAQDPKFVVEHECI